MNYNQSLMHTHRSEDKRAIFYGLFCYIISLWALIKRLLTDTDTGKTTDKRELFFIFRYVLPGNKN